MNNTNNTSKVEVDSEVLKLFVKFVHAVRPEGDYESDEDLAKSTDLWYKVRNEVKKMGL